MTLADPEHAEYDYDVLGNLDECIGRFWEGRCEVQRLADDAGLLACAVCVELNPTKAAVAESPEAAKHTSAYDRLYAER